MKTFTRIAKYLATAFAIFLIVAIFSIIIGAGQGILTMIGFSRDDSAIEMIDKTSYLDIDTGCVDLKIEKADELKIESRSDNIVVEQDGEKIKIKDESNSFFGCDKREVLVYLPENVEFEAISIKSGAGKIIAEDLKANEIYFSLGAGEMVIDKLVSKNPRIKAGAGSLTIKSGELANLKLEMGAGEAKISASLTGENKIECGIGRLELNLASAKSEYTFDLEKGLGALILNGENLSNNATIGSGENKIEIDGGIGEIDIKTRE
ncbi:DUF4097 family beta strand repeat protein [Candidatus Saccharibacteria bacterium]|nr:DUF4097 family beta strand repeat protein [Candidatus Saccharibacteria bacterium]